LRSVIAATLLWLAFLPLCQAQNGADRFERITPEQAGYSNEKLDQLRKVLLSSGSQSMLLLYDGKVFFEWGDIRKKILVHSIRKALLSSLYGIYVERGTIDLQQTLAQLDIDDAPQALSAQERSAQLLDLLKSRSGIYHDAAAEAESMLAARPTRGAYLPGTHYYYNNWDFNVAGHVFERASGMRIYDAFDKYIAQPLGMLDYHGKVVAETEAKTADVDGFYQLEPQRSRYPAFHFRMSAHDLALYGQLMLNRGNWRGRQLVPANWIASSTQPYSMTEPAYGLGYGMLWSVVVADKPGAAAFFHTGAGVHMLGIYPRHRLVMVHRVDTEQGSTFDDGKLYALIRLMHAARLPVP
jgi:CubicO group peptidase (beta-lactamase class C family)